MNRMKNLLFVSALGLTYGIGQLYTCFDTSQNAPVYNWIWLVEVKASLAWNVKQVADNLNWFLVPLIFYGMLKQWKDCPIEFLIAAQIYTLHRFFDIVLHFVNFKTDYYECQFIVISLIECYCWRKLIRKKISNKKPNQ